MFWILHLQLHFSRYYKGDGVVQTFATITTHTAYAELSQWWCHTLGVIRMHCYFQDSTFHICFICTIHGVTRGPCDELWPVVMVLNQGRMAMFGGSLWLHIEEGSFNLPLCVNGVSSKYCCSKSTSCVTLHCVLLGQYVYFSFLETTTKIVSKSKFLKHEPYMTILIARVGLRSHIASSVVFKVQFEWSHSSLKETMWLRLYVTKQCRCRWMPFLSIGPCCGYLSLSLGHLSQLPVTCRTSSHRACSAQSPVSRELRIIQDIFLHLCGVPSLYGLVLIICSAKK